MFELKDAIVLDDPALVTDRHNAIIRATSSHRDTRQAQGCPHTAGQSTCPLLLFNRSNNDECHDDDITISRRQPFLPSHSNLTAKWPTRNWKNASSV